jgi:DNA transposition AAA+ family ATPase
MLQTEEPVTRIPVETLRKALDIDSEPDKALSTLPRGGNPNWMSADKLKADLANSAYSEEQQNDCVWLLNHARRLKVPSQAALAELIGFQGDATMLSRLLRGIYPGSEEVKARFFARIGGFRQMLLDQQQYGDEPLVVTSVVTEIGKVCDLARASCTIGLVHGENQSGKTKALKRYRDLNNHGRTVYLRLRPGAATGAMSRDLCKACGISPKNNDNERFDRLEGYFDAQTLLIVDEFHEAFLGPNGTISIKTRTIEYLRSIHDLSGCGVVFCGTDVFVEQMDGSKHKAFLGQLANRGVLRLYVPTAPKRADLLAVLAAYGLDAPKGEARRKAEEIANGHGIGRLTKYLRMARGLATKRGEEISWDHFLFTQATLQQCASGAALVDKEDGQ